MADFFMILGIVVVFLAIAWEMMGRRTAPAPPPPSAPPPPASTPPAPSPEKKDTVILPVPAPTLAPSSAELPKPSDEPKPRDVVPPIPATTPPPTPKPAKKSPEIPVFVDAPTDSVEVLTKPDPASKLEEIEKALGGLGPDSFEPSAEKTTVTVKKEFTKAKKPAGAKKPGKKGGK